MEIIGLSFECRGDFDFAGERIDKFLRRLDIEYDILFAGCRSIVKGNQGQLNANNMKKERGSSPPHNQAYINTGTGPVVILLHGLFGNVEMWKYAVDALKIDFQVVVPRLPLFELPTEHSNVKHLVTALHEFIEWSRLTGVTLVGHGIGGQVALIYAGQYPHKVKKLVLTSSSGLMEKSLVLDLDEDPEYSYVHDKIEEAFYLREFITNELVDDIYTTVKSIHKRMALWNFVRSSRQTNVAPLLAKISHPVLLIWGLQDKITPPEAALHFHDLLPNAEVKFIDKCGHVAMIEKSGEFNAHLLSFLRPTSKGEYWYTRRGT